MNGFSIQGTIISVVMRMRFRSYSTRELLPREDELCNVDIEVKGGNNLNLYGVECARFKTGENVRIMIDQGPINAR